MYTRIHKPDSSAFCLCFCSKKKNCTNSHKGELTMIWLYWLSIYMATS